MDIQKRLKELSSDSTERYRLQDQVLLLKSFKGLEAMELREAVREFSRENPMLAFRCIAEPFVQTFGKFCRQEDVLGRWLSVSEVAVCMRERLQGYVDPDVLRRWEQWASVRKIISGVEDWSRAVKRRRGALKVADRIKDADALHERYTSYLLAEVERAPSEFEEFSKFLDFAVEQLTKMEAQRLETLAKQLVIQFRSMKK